VRWVRGAVELDEEALHVPIEATLAYLIRDGLDERVVATFGARAQL
jgi:hypothetical protein